MATKLSVNVNKIATLRNTRPNLNIPDLLALSRVALETGVHGLTIHPRPDERHIRGSDVEPLADLLRAFPGAEFNIEGNPFQGRYMEHCRTVRPTQCTLVPDAEGQSTSDHGFDLAEDGQRLRPIIAELKSLGCRVSLFMDPDAAAIPLAKDIGADRVELYTEPFATAFEREAPDDTTSFRHSSIMTPYVDAAEAAHEHGLGVNAGHDLNVKNLGPFLAMVRGVEEVSIGHALVADALLYGLPEAIRRYARVKWYKNTSYVNEKFFKPMMVPLRMDWVQ